MATYTQAGKAMRVTTPLGPDVFLLESLAGREAVSEPFELTLDLLSTNPGIDADALLRKPVTVTFALESGQKRFFHGLVRQFVQLGRTPLLVSYRAEVVPALWFLTLSTNCRIFQQMTVPDILQKVLRNAGVTDIRLALSGNYHPRDYCVQYRESDFAFVSRLMEEEGIFYFFEHAESKHTIVLADSMSAVKAGVVAKLPITYVDVDESPLDEAITSFQAESHVRSGKMILIDYNDTVPKRLETTVAGTAPTAAKNLELYDYPGKFDAVDAGERLARVRLEAHEASARVVVGTSNCRALGSGQKLEITEHYRRDLNQAYHLLTLQHAGRAADVHSDGGDQSRFHFETRFVAMPYSVPFRPERRTPKAIVHGTHTAVVVGPAGEEIYVDKFGRVKVQFFWDRQGKHDENSSCWVRVSSAWAGKTWGAVHIPRIGQEVIVDFLEGDPDRPIITGRVYNAEQMPPYALPANGTQSGIKSRSSKGGDAANANELRFEDKKGSEQVYFHAEKDLSSIVLNDESRDVGHDRTTVIKNNETRTVKEGDDTTTIEKGNQTVTVKKGNQIIAVDEGDQTITVAKGKQTVTIDQDRTITIKEGNDSLVVKTGDLSTEVKTGNVSTAVKTGNLSTKVDLGNVTLKTGVGSITYEAMQGIELKVGSNSIKIDQTGITIKGLMVSVQGSVQTEVKGTMTTVKGDGMLTMKGGITMIN